jgi:hypothetical protein
MRVGVGLVDPAVEAGWDDRDDVDVHGDGAVWRGGERVLAGAEEVDEAVLNSGVTGEHEEVKSPFVALPEVV